MIKPFRYAYIETSSLAAISLSGPTFRSYAIAIPLNLSEEKEKKRLEKFKDSIQSKTKIFAFALIPAKNDTYEQELSKTQIFRNLFPSIELISFFNDKDFPIFLADTSDSSKYRKP